MFQVLGLFLLVAGFFVKFATDYVDKYGKEIINAVKDKVPEQIGDKLEVCYITFEGNSISLKYSFGKR